MQPILHIFWKDVSHLWKELAVTWALLAFLTQLDSGRDGYVPNSAEGWLNMLLPLAWSYLSSLCVLQDAIPGERQFWLTFPHRRNTLLGAKLLFIGACIHAPYLLSNAVVLEARGFQPLQFIGDLLRKQVFLLVVLTLPSLALASVTRSATQFIALATSIAGTAILVCGNGELSPLSSQPLPWQSPDDVRRNLALALLTLFSAAVLLLQYRDRHTRLSRILGLGGLLATGALYLWLPPRISATIETSLSRPSALAQPVSVRALEPGPKLNANFSLQRDVSGISIPIAMTGLLPNDHLRFQSLDFAIDTENGVRFSGDGHRKGLSHSHPVLAFISATEDQSPKYNLILELERSIYSRVVSHLVTLKGHLVLEEHRSVTRLALSNRARTDLPNFGKCAVSLASEHRYQDDMLRAACESPGKLPQARGVLTDPTTGRQWDELLGGSVTRVSYPRNTWLSPVNRREVFFHLTSRDTSQPEMRWQVPASILGHYLLEIEPQPLVRRTVVEYSLSGIELSRYAIDGPH